MLHQLQNPKPYPAASPPPQDAYFYSGQAVRVFGIAIALLIVLVETEWHRFMHLVPLLDAWLGRGILHVSPACGSACPGLDAWLSLPPRPLGEPQGWPLCWPLRLSRLRLGPSAVPLAMRVSSPTHGPVTVAPADL